MKLVRSSMGGLMWIYGPGGVFLKICGDVFDAQNFGTSVLNILPNEIAIGLEDASENKNDVMEFGEINGMFLFSRKGMKSSEDS